MRLELTLPALERLLGGDTEIEVALRYQIVEQFAAKHLKALMNQETFKAITATWKAEIGAQVAATMKTMRDQKQETINSGEAAQSALKWTWDFRDTISKAAAKVVEQAIELETENSGLRISRLVRSEVNKQIEQGVTAELAARVKDRTTELGRLIDDEVEARIRERLEAAKNLAAKKS